MKKPLTIAVCFALLFLAFSSGAHAVSTVSGTIFSTDTGLPLANAMVRAYEVSDGMPTIGTTFFETTSAANGQYMLTVTQPGSYIVVAAAPGYAAGFFWNWLELTGSNSFSNIIIPLDPAPSIRGRVTNGSGTPIAGLPVYALEPGGLMLLAIGRTDANGDYVTTGIGSGTEAIVFVDAAATPYMSEYFQNAYAAQDADVLVMTEVDETGIDLVLDLGGSISGVARDIDGNPVANVAMRAYGVASGVVRSGVTGTGGGYTIEGLPSGAYRVYADGAGTAFLSKYYLNATDANDATQVSVTSGVTTPDINITLTRGGSISGRITDSYGAPVAGASVSAGGITAISDAQGYYLIGRLPSNIYLVVASFPAYITKYYYNAYDDLTATKVAVTDGRDTPNINISLDNMGSLSGRVMSATAVPAPVEGAMVQLYDAATQQLLAIEVTDSSGNYRVTGLFTGDYAVEVSHQDYVTEYYDNAATFAQATPVSVVFGVETPGINVGMTVLGAISGVVTDQNTGFPVANATVTAYDGNYNQVKSAQTATTGSFLLAGLSAGDYKLGVTHPAYSSEYYNDAAIIDSAALVSVSNGAETTGISIALARLGSISGTVRDSASASLAGIEVTAYGINGGEPYTAQTSTTGAYSIIGLQPGDYRVFAAGAGFVTKYYSDTTDWNLADPVTVLAETNTPNINITLPRTASVSGVVLNAPPCFDQGCITANVFVLDAATGLSVASGQVDQFGAYSISGVPPGSYKLWAEGVERLGEYRAAYYPSTLALTTAATVTIGEGAAVLNKNITLLRAVAIEGQIVDSQTYEQLSGMTVVVSNGTATATMVTGQYGGFNYLGSIPDGEYVVRVLGGTNYADEYYSHFGGTNDPAEATALYIASANYNNLGAFAMDRKATIFGKVLDDTMQAVAGIWMRADNGATVYSAQTNSLGAYTITGLTPGGYRLRAETEGTSFVGEYYNDKRTLAEAEYVYVNYGTDAVLNDMVLARGGDISGTVTDSVTTAPIAGTTVSVYDVTSWTPILLASGLTGTTGAYTISSVPTGTWMVVAGKPGSSYVRQIYSGAGDRIDRTPVGVAAEATTGGIDFALLPGGTISGRVLRSNGDALAQVNVAAFLPNGTEVAESLTAADGTYELDGVPAGSVTVAARPDGIPEVAGQFYGGGIHGDTAMPVSVTTGTTTPGIDIVLPDGVTYQVQLTADWNTPRDGNLNVYVYDAVGWRLVVPAAVRAYPDMNPGTWDITLPGGAYVMQAQALSDTGVTRSFFFDWNNGITNFLANASVVYGSGPSPQGLYMQLYSGPAANGTVAYGGVKTGKVIVYAADTAVGTGWPDQGGFVIGKPGPYNLALPQNLSEVGAFMDVNGNGRQDPDEPFSTCTSGNCVVNGNAGDLAGINLTLNDPVTTATVTITESGGAVATPSGAVPVALGSTLTFQVNTAGYPAVYGCRSTLVSRDTDTYTYTTGTITADCPIAASVNASPFLKIVNAGAGTGWTEVLLNGSYNSVCYSFQDECTPIVSLNDTVTMTATADGGSVFAGWSGACTGMDPCVVTMDQSRGVAATFVRQQFTVTASADTGGSVVPGGQQSIPYGGSRTFIAVPSIGYSLAGISGTCAGSQSGLLYTIATPVSDCSFTAAFAINQYQVAVSAIANGTVAPEGPINVTHGDALAFTITPATGYRIGSVTGCGGTLAGSTYTIAHVTSSCEVSPVFVNAAPTIPVLVVPASDSELTTRSPLLHVLATDADGDPVSYQFEVSPLANFQIVLSRGTVTAQPDGSGQWTPPAPLNDNTFYYWRARARDAAGWTSFMSPAGFFVNTVNDAPMAPAINAPADGTQVGSLRPSLSVLEAGDIDRDALHYEFQLSLSGGFGALVETGTLNGPNLAGNIVSWQTSSLTESVTYHWRSRAVDEHGLPGPWAASSFYVNASNEAPTVPALSLPAAGSEVAGTTPTLIIMNSTDPEGSPLVYYFQIDTVATFNSGSVIGSGVVVPGGGTTSFTAPVLNDNTRYYWRAKASDGAAESGWMTTATFFVNTANDAPTAPSADFPADQAWITTVTPQLSVFAAGDVDGDALTYEYEIYSDRDLFSIVKSAAGQGISWTIPGFLSDNTWYFWRARARDEHGLAGAWTAPVQFFVNNTGYNDPPAIAITAPTANEVIVTGQTYIIRWTDSDPDDNAMITLGYDTTGSGCSGTTIQTSISENDPGNSYTWDTTGLGPGTYHVYAKIDDSVNPPVCVYVPGPVSSTVSGGDADGDGKTDIFDVLKALRLATGLETPTQTSVARADVAPLVNGVSQPDGNVTFEDVLVILRKAAGLW